ncbi:hypothetical protein SMKI_15G5060 [Saccharomyces mikatae IFO 1815]|uniref:Uncharacterized protein n=1 Tax=Saccharomyces mikatae IFO 1815 TaxID=226126 RepID=A0AA35IVU0_SACMI|nr:uncharacterized protein SMKI_15G5060 [Saccharomyces mikatae IFO 1815]CAI4036655.1 hypothetical protein SMKI_15G5060 [Saccharomyces mikatae IFO 1815]
MPIARILGTRGFFVFSSKQSYDRFKETNFNISVLDSEGVGVPFLHIVRNYNVIGHLTGSSPDFHIYKYVLQKAEDPPLYSESKVICEDKAFRLCKIPYCEIYSHLNFLKTKYDFFYPSGTQFHKKYQVVKQNNFRDLDTYLDGLHFHWHVKFYSDHYRLMYFNEYDLGSSNDARAKRKQSDAPDIDIVVGHYTKRFSNFIPRSISKCSELVIGEQSRPDSLGISSVPVLTETFACQGALIHYLEHIEEKNRK